MQTLYSALAICTIKGTACAEDYKEAIKWIRKAAYKNHVEQVDLMLNYRMSLTHDTDAIRWMDQCEKEWRPSNLPGAITMRGNYKWCQCLVTGMLSGKAQLSEATKEALATNFRKSLGRVWAEIKDADNSIGKCYNH